MNRGNGAREALIKILTDDGEEERPDLLADYLLTMLWLAGFVVKPLSAAEQNPEGK